MLKLALTGGIASGKTTALNFFKKQGIASIDCDAIVRQLYRRKSVRKRVLAEFKTMSRKKIAEIIFSSKAKRKRLEAILHPLVLEEVEKKLNRFRKARRKLVVIDIPLLFEAGLQRLADRVIVVSCTREQQLQRLLRKGLTRKQALQRISSQLPLGKKIKKAHYVIDNSKGLRETKRQVLHLIRRLSNG